MHRVHTLVPRRRDARSLEALISGMDMEFRDDRRRGKFIIVLGLVLAVVAGGAAFYLVNQAHEQAGQSDLQKVSIVVAVRAIPARQAIVAEDVTVREVPLDPTNANGVVTDPNEVIGRIPAVGYPPLEPGVLVNAVTASGRAARSRARAVRSPCAR